MGFWREFRGSGGSSGFKREFRGFGRDFRGSGGSKRVQKEFGRIWEGFWGFGKGLDIFLFLILFN